MSRTYRKNSDAFKWFKRLYRHPRTYSELKQLDSLNCQEDFTPRNRDKNRSNNLPTSWDDKRKSASYEDYDIKHFHERE